MGSTASIGSVGSLWSIGARLLDPHLGPLLQGCLLHITHLSIVLISIGVCHTLSSSTYDICGLVNVVCLLCPPPPRQRGEHPEHRQRGLRALHRLIRVRRQHAGAPGRPQLRGVPGRGAARGALGPAPAAAGAARAAARARARACGLADRRVFLGLCQLQAMLGGVMLQ